MLFATSCSNEADEIQNITNEKKETIEVATRNNTSSALKNIQNYIKNGKFGGADTRSLKNITIDPYVIDGDTAMYIANYGNGWELFSTDQRTPLIMASAESGSLEINDESLPPALGAYIYSIADEIHQLKQIGNEDNTINPEWMIYPENMEELSLGEVASTNEQYEPGVGHWELINSIVISENITYESPRYIKTKWDQEYPFNQYIPFSLSNGSYVDSPAGCGAVATAQYLYFLHNKNGIPATTISTASLVNATTNKYTFSNKNSTVWSQMAKLGNQNLSKVAKSAMFIAYIAQQINTEYHVDGSKSEMTDACNFISKESGISHSYVNCNYSYVIDQLRNNQMPVVLCAKNNSTNNAIGHTFIADQIIEKKISYRDYYGWVGTTSTGENANYIDESNGHIIGYKIKKEETRGPVTEYRIKMNWGYGGEFDDVICNTTAISDWQANYYQWNYQRKMLKR